ncbi:hypothetical protein [Algoriphagus boritolerans]|uniref:hypothetical protein n=1 Tax=Algoriphagus boritolerans TaxID=308111 RepID=UPI000A92329B
MFTGIFKILIPLIIVLPGVIAFYYYGEQYFGDQDVIYPVLVKKSTAHRPDWLFLPQWF